MPRTFPINNMRKLILTAITVVAALGATAAELTPSEALARLSASGGPQMAPAHGAAMPVLSYTVSDETQQRAMAYVFNRPVSGSGYIIVSADDTAPALLGYSDNGSFDIATAPPAMREWLDGYARRIAWGVENASISRAAEPEVKQRAEIAPKLTTKWNQDAPYWNRCPKINNKSCYTGCVATAMAQIMNWHEWPKQPTGKVSYKAFYVSGFLALDFDTVRFEWDKMLDTYTTKSPAENADAVATLMQACGYAAEMEYGTGVSGALTYKAAAGMVTYFGYDKALSVQKRDWYDTSSWEDMVYDELSNNGPVYYDGSGEGGGHAFVCDGYRASDGFFHFNWGWAGLSDGYFRLDALYPQEQGAGGVAVGYTWDQAIMRGLHKAQEGSEMTTIIGTYAGVKSPYTEQVLGKHFSMLGYETNDGFVNYSIFPVTDLYFGAEIRNKATGEARYVPRANSNNDSSNYGPVTMEPYTKHNVLLYYLPADLPEGDYTVRPVYRLADKGEWNTLVGNPAFRQHIDIRVEGNTAYFSNPEAEATIRVTFNSIPEYFTSGGSYTIGCTVTNTGTRDFSGTICGTFLTQEDDKIKVAAKGRDEYVTVEAGNSINLEYSSTVVSGSIEDGDYGFCFGNSTTGEIISDMAEAFVGNRYGSLILTYFNLDIADRMMLDAGNVHATAEITCPQGTYDGPMALLLSTSKRNFKPEFKILSEPYQFTAVETKPIEINGVFAEAELGMTYYGLIGYRGADGEYVAIGTNPIPVTIAAVSGIETIGADSDITLCVGDGTITVSTPRAIDSVNMFSLSGSRIAVPVSIDGCSATLSPESNMHGIFILTITTADGRTLAAKVSVM